MSGLPLDFPPPPANPHPGQNFTGPLGVTWTWDGQKWTAGGGAGSGGGGIADAPMDGNTYGRNTGNWVQVLALTGGTMSGQIILPPGTPSNPLSAVTKQYVDEAANLTGLYLGTWQVAANNPNISMGGTVDSSNYLAITANPNVAEMAPSNIPGIGGTMINNGDRIVWASAIHLWQRVPGDSLDLQIGDSRYLQLAGGTMTGDEYLANGVLLGMFDTQNSPITLQVQGNDVMVWNVTNSGGGPEMMFSVPVHADNTMLTVGLSTTFDSTVWLSSDPVALMQAATKQYVDSHIAAVAGGLQFVGTIDGSTGQCAFTAASSITPNPGPLPPAADYPNAFVVCDNPGTIPSGPAIGIPLSSGDWLVSDGVNWNHIAIGSAGLLAQDIVVSPAVNGATNVQQALQNIAGNYLPLSGGVLSGPLYVASPNNLVVGRSSGPTNAGPSQVITPYLTTIWEGFNCYVTNANPLTVNYLNNGPAASIAQDSVGNLLFSTASSGTAGTPVPALNVGLMLRPAGNVQIGSPTGSINYILQILSGPSGNANISMTVSGVREWSCGVSSDGQFHIADSTAQTDRIIVGTTGNVNIYGPGLVYNFYDDNVFAFMWDGVFVQIIVDGGSTGQYAPIGYNDARYLFRNGDTSGGAFTLGSLDVQTNASVNGTLGVTGNIGVDGAITCLGIIYDYNRVIVTSSYPALCMDNNAAGLAGAFVIGSEGLAFGQSDASGDLANSLMTVEWDGWLYMSGGVGTPSDVKLKDNIAPSGAFDSLSAIRALKSVSFDWKNKGAHQPFGLTAENVREVLPDVVRRSNDLDHLDLTALLVHSLRAIQQLAEKIGA